jgi:hypothetical protein
MAAADGVARCAELTHRGLPLNHLQFRLRAANDDQLSFELDREVGLICARVVTRSKFSVEVRRCESN